MNLTKTKPQTKRAPWRTLLIAALLLAALALWLWPKPEAPQAPAESTQPPFDQELSDRETAYTKDVEALRAIAENELCDEQTRNDAAARLTRLVTAHRTEQSIGEALRKAGFSPSLTLCENGALTIMLAQEKLTDEESARLLGLCAAHTDLSLENIRVMTGVR